jgi:MFS family permease
MSDSRPYPAFPNWLTPASLVLIGLLVLVTVVSQFHRNAVGVLVPDLVREIGLNPAQAGLLASSFFLVFALAQIPVGIALDRFGPVRVLAASGLIAAAGAALFAVSTGPTSLILSRALLGIGCASFLMAPLAIYAQLYARDRFSTLTGLQLGIGSLGALFATAPFASLVAALGWRPAVGLMAGLTLVIPLIVAASIRSGTTAMPVRGSETLRESLRGVADVVRQPDAGRLFLMHLAAYSTFVTMLALWGGTYLAHVHGLGLEARGKVLFVFTACQIAGLILWGTSDRLFGAYRRPVLIGAGSSAMLLLVLAWAGPFPLPITVAWFALFGFCCAYTPVLVAHGRSIFPDALVGRGITVMNIGTMGGAFLMQTLTGAVVGLFAPVGGAYPLAAFQTIFTLQAICVLAITWAYSRAHDPRRNKT